MLFRPSFEIPPTAAILRFPGSGHDRNSEAEGISWVGSARSGLRGKPCSENVRTQDLDHILHYITQNNPTVALYKYICSLPS